MNKKLQQIAEANDRLHEIWEWLFWDFMPRELGKSISFENKMNEMEKLILEIDSIAEPYKENKKIDNAIIDLKQQVKSMFEAINELERPIL